MEDIHCPVASTSACSRPQVSRSHPVSLTSILTATYNTIFGDGSGGGYHLISCTDVSVQLSSSLSLLPLFSHLDIDSHIQHHFGRRERRRMFFGQLHQRQRAVVLRSLLFSPCLSHLDSGSHIQYHLGKWRLRWRIFFVQLHQRQHAVVLGSLALTVFFSPLFGQPHTTPSAPTKNRF